MANVSPGLLRVRIHTGKQVHATDSLIKKTSRHTAGRKYDYFFLKMGTVLHGSPYMILLATGRSFFVISR